MKKLISLIVVMSFSNFILGKVRHSKSHQERTAEKIRTRSRSANRDDAEFRKGENPGSKALQVACLQRCCKEKNSKLYSKL